ncbi:hypothetical protein HK096_009189 [Nowakowskiella sp. JEL0078]|nr:hypothetical protein HK096_009189 [Nowakowskiella sp. JEL0078]
MHPWFISYVPNAREIAKAVLAMPQQNTPPQLSSTPQVSILSIDGQHEVRFLLGSAHDGFKFDDEESSSEYEISAILSTLSNRFEDPEDFISNLSRREISSEDLVNAVALNVPRNLLEIGLENPTPDNTIMASLPNLADTVWRIVQNDIGNLEYGQDVSDPVSRDETRELQLSQRSQFKASLSFDEALSSKLEQISLERASAGVEEVNGVHDVESTCSVSASIPTKDFLEETEGIDDTKKDGITDTIKRKSILGTIFGSMKQ